MLLPDSVHSGNQHLEVREVFDVLEGWNDLPPLTQGSWEALGLHVHPVVKHSAATCFFTSKHGVGQSW